MLQSVYFIEVVQLSLFPQCEMWILLPQQCKFLYFFSLFDCYFKFLLHDCIWSLYCFIEKKKKLSMKLSVTVQGDNFTPMVTSLNNC